MHAAFIMTNTVLIIETNDFFGAYFTMSALRSGMVYIRHQKKKVFDELSEIPFYVVD